jgi:hypothetical protein
MGSSIDLSIRFNKHIKDYQFYILLQKAIDKYKLQARESFKILFLNSLAPRTASLWGQPY